MTVEDAEPDVGGDEHPDPTRCKVGRLLAEYDLDGLGADLERRWTAPDCERESLRSLADRVNRRVLESELRRADEAPTTVELDGLYEGLTGDDVDGTARTRTRRELERRGVDVESLRDRFVTHQAVHTYLTDYRGASYEREPASVETERATLARLRNRTSAVTQSALDRLVDADRLADRDYDPLVSVRVLCGDCGRSHDVDELLDAGGCDCERGDAAGSGDGSGS